ncbi:hypothetical protein AB0N23_00440 [Streptomyces sp. NPDC052644]
MVNPHMWMDPEGLIAKGCTENGGWYSGLTPANLKNADGSRRTGIDLEINRIPAKLLCPPRRAGFQDEQQRWRRGDGPIHPHGVRRPPSDDQHWFEC